MIPRRGGLCEHAVSASPRAGPGGDTSRPPGPPFFAKAVAGAAVCVSGCVSTGPAALRALRTPAPCWWARQDVDSMPTIDRSIRVADAAPVTTTRRSSDPPDPRPNQRATGRKEA